MTAIYPAPTREQIVHYFLERNRMSNEHDRLDDNPSSRIYREREEAAIKAIQESGWNHEYTYTPERDRRYVFTGEGLSMGGEVITGLEKLEAIAFRRSLGLKNPPTSID